MNYIICLKWGKKYSAEYVNKLYSMLSKHVHVPFTLTCMTNEPDGILPEIKIKTKIIC